ncbi:hypothetical protein ACPOL_6657 [Acidisarcina polymorpha]|uniref:Uncharacterized protein n=1 Tax=Acidisarcina polymorpha TaxID=2211140 RepID=A0A2Z5GA17_9BACT|nr:hypothetical protein ACPOL_6657 [Acidisarcina polymorpha]
MSSYDMDRYLSRCFLRRISHQNQQIQPHSGQEISEAKVSSTFG